MSEAIDAEDRSPRSKKPLVLVVVALLGAVALLLAWPLLRHHWLGWSAPPASDAELAPLREIPPYSDAALESLFQADQADRSHQPIDWDVVRVNDAERRQIVTQWLNEGCVQGPRNLYCAAMVFQHGRTTEHYAQAVRLATQAAELGNEDAKWLKAATEDRLLLSQGKPQKYGTQFQRVGGTWHLSPVDPEITDEQRARWNVPPLADAKAQVHRMNSERDP